MEMISSVPWLFPDSTVFRWGANEKKIPKLEARKISRLGHPMVRWMKVVCELLDEGQHSIDNPGLLVAELRLHQNQMEWMDVHSSKALLAAVVEKSEAKAEVEPDMSVRVKSLADFGDVGAFESFSGSVFRRGKIMSTLPAWRSEFLNRMRRGHWSRVRQLFSAEWELEAGDLELGAQYPGLNFRSWNELAETKDEDWELSCHDGQTWVSFNRSELSSTEWKAQVESALVGGHLSFVRRPRAGDRFLAIYGRNASGWTEFLGCLSMQRFANEVILDPVVVKQD